VNPGVGVPIDTRLKTGHSPRQGHGAGPEVRATKQRLVSAGTQAACADWSSVGSAEVLTPRLRVRLARLKVPAHQINRWDHNSHNSKGTEKSSVHLGLRIGRGHQKHRR